MASTTILDQIRKLDEQKSKLLNEAKDTALAAANAAIADLNELGYHFRLVEGVTRDTMPSESRKGTRGVKDEPCPICNFKTNPLHDRRSHRTQEPKKPFTDAELKAKGMTKV